MSTQINRDEHGNPILRARLTRRGFMVNAGLIGLGTMGLGSLLTACGSGAGGSGTPIKGGTLTFAIDGTNGSLDPASYTTMGDWLAVDTICSGLTVADFSTNAISGSVARDWSFSSDGLTLTVNLRDDVHFHDGSLLKASDVVRTLNRQFVDGDKSLPSGASRPLRGVTANNVVKVEAKNDTTVVFTLKVPDAILPARLSHVSAYLLQASQIESLGGKLGTKLIGTGPFKLANIAAQQSITLEAFPNYFGGAPALERLVFQQVADASSLTAGLQGGRVNASSFVSHSSAASLKAQPKVKVYDVPRRVNIFVMMNVNSAALTDIRVRKAVNLAIDRAKVCANAFAGFAEEPKGYALPPVNIGHDPALADLSTFDRAAAIALIKEAGAEGKQVSLIAQNNNWYPRAAQILEENLKAIGLVPKVELLDPGTFSGRFFDAAKHDLALWERNGYFPDPDDQVGNLLLSTGGYGKRAMGSATRPEYAGTVTQVDQLLRSATQTTDAAKRTALYSQAQRLHAEKIMGLSMVCYTQSIVASNGATNIGAPSLASQRGQLGSAALTA